MNGDTLNASNAIFLKLVDDQVRVFTKNAEQKN